MMQNEREENAKFEMTDSLKRSLRDVRQGIMFLRGGCGIELTRKGVARNQLERVGDPLTRRWEDLR